MCALGGLFKEYRILFIDGDSTDGTKEMFDSIVQNCNAIEVVFKIVPSNGLLETKGTVYV
jgi:hypothetical protein